MHALEYLVAGLIMIIFISFSSAVFMPSVYIPLTHIREQQLDVLAERTIDKILLTPGAPYNWDDVTVTGTDLNLTQLSGFGLALYEETIGSPTEPYLLDRDKVLRLNESLLDPLEVARSLGFMEDNHLKYGFRITIKPAINIHINVIKYTDVDKDHQAYGSIRVNVKNYEDIPLANAKVYGIVVVFCVDQTTVDAYPIYPNKPSITNVLGEATIDFNYTDIIDKLTGYQKYAFLYITYIDFYGLKSYEISSPSDIETPALILPTKGGIMVLHNSSTLPRGSIHMRGVFGINIPYNTFGNVEVRKVWVRTKGAEALNIINHGGKEYTYYTLEGVEQDLNAIGIVFKYTGECHFYVVSLRYIIREGLHYGFSGMGGKKVIVVAKRLVRIEGIDYVFEFRMWRMAED